MEALSEMEKRLQNMDLGSEVNHLRDQMRALQKDKVVCKVNCLPLTIRLFSRHLKDKFHVFTFCKYQI